MSGRRAWRRRRARLFSGAVRVPPRAALAAGAAGGTVGHDVGRRGARTRPRLAPWLPLAVLALGAALALAGLRVSILRARYALGEAHRAETRLLEARREARVELRRLRDPQRLRERARELGFERPERVIRLPAAARGAGSSAEAP